MEYAMRIIISVGEQIFCSWLFHVQKFYDLISLQNYNYLVSEFETLPITAQANI